jgi:hypothetical protein
VRLLMTWKRGGKNSYDKGGGVAYRLRFQGAGAGFRDDPL